MVAALCRCFHGSSSSEWSSSSPVSKLIPNPFRGGTTPSVYANDSFGIEGFRAFDNVRLKPVFHAAAAILIGVFGVGGVGLLSNSAEMTISFASFAGKGSEFRKACFVDVTREDRLEAIFEDFRGGNVVREGVDSWGSVPKE